MGVEEDVRGHPTLCEGHVCYRPALAAHTLLTMPAGELVSNDRIPLSRNGGINK